MLVDLRSLDCHFNSFLITEYLVKKKKKKEQKMYELRENFDTKKLSWLFLG